MAISEQSAYKKAQQLTKKLETSITAANAALVDLKDLKKAVAKTVGNKPIPPGAGSSAGVWGY